MSNKVNMISVEDIKKINKTKYKNGDFFLSRSKLYILLDNKLKPLTQNHNMKDYIKKSELDDYLKETYPQLFTDKEGETA